MVLWALWFERIKKTFFLVWAIKNERQSRGEWVREYNERESENRGRVIDEREREKVEKEKIWCITIFLPFWKCLQNKH